MSYILDALRKVERERRQPQVATINLEHRAATTSPYRWGLILVVLLVLINLGWLTYNAFTPRTIDAGDSKKTDTVNTVATKQPALVKPQPDKKRANRQSIKEFQASKHQSKQKPAGIPPRSIADLTAYVNQQKQVQSEPVIPTNQQPRPVVKSQAIKAERLIPKPEKNNPPQTALNRAPTRPETSQSPTSANPKQNRRPIAPVRKMAPNTRQTASKARKTEKIPMLRQMSAQFRDDLPRLDINVYVHADDSSNAFVIINMRKYRIGDRIGENLKLISIGVDGMTLSKNGKKFQIARP